MSFRKSVRRKCLALVAITNSDSAIHSKEGKVCTPWNLVRAYHKTGDRTNFAINCLRVILLRLFCQKKHRLVTVKPTRLQIWQPQVTFYCRTSSNQQKRQKKFCYTEIINPFSILLKLSCTCLLLIQHSLQVNSLITHRCTFIVLSPCFLTLL